MRCLLQAGGLMEGCKGDRLARKIIRTCAPLHQNIKELQ